MVDLSKLTTESRNPATMDLDHMTPLELATVMNREDENVVAGGGFRKSHRQSHGVLRA